MSTTTRVNRAFLAGMAVGGIIVLMVFWFLVTADSAAASETDDCDRYVASATCNLENPPTLFTPAPAEKAPNCVEREEIGHCSDLLAATGQGNNLHLVGIGVALVLFGGIIALIVLWNVHIKRGDD